MRSLGGALANRTLAFKKGVTHQGCMSTEERPCEDTGKSVCLQARGEVSLETNLAITLILDV
jgi:hypothetical protein